MSIDELKSFHKMSKLQKADYIKQNDVTYIEQKLSELDLDEYQYDFLTKAELSFESEIKEKLRSGIKHLIQARDTLFDILACHLTGKSVLIYSQILTQDQLLKFFVSELAKPLDSRWNILNLFGIKTKSETIKLNSIDNKYLGKYVAKHVKPEDQVIELNLRKMEFDDEMSDC